MKRWLSSLQQLILSSDIYQEHSLSQLVAHIQQPKISKIQEYLTNLPLTESNPKQKKNIQKILFTKIFNIVRSIDDETIKKQEHQKILKMLLSRMIKPTKKQDRDQVLNENPAEKDKIICVWNKRTRNKRRLSLLFGAYYYQKEVFKEIYLQEYFQKNKADIQKLNEILRQYIVQFFNQENNLDFFKTELQSGKKEKAKSPKIFEYLIHFVADLDKGPMKIYQRRNKTKTILRYNRNHESCQ